MKTFLSLCKVQILAFAGINGSGTGKRKKARSLSGKLLFLVFFGAVIAYVGYAYSQMFVGILSDSISELIPIMIGFSSIVAFWFSFYATGNVLFSSKDYELLSSMPIKTGYIILSKLTFMLLSDLAFSVLITVPAICVYCGIEVLSVLSITEYIVLAIFSSFLPLCFSIIVGTVISYLSSFFKKKNIIQTVMFLLFFVAVYLVMFMLSDSKKKGVINIIKKVCFLTGLRIKAQNSGLYLALYIAVEVLSFFVISFVVSKLYIFFNTVLSVSRTRKSFKLKSYSKKGLFRTLLKKELIRLVSSPIYFINCVLGSMLSFFVVIGGSIVVFSMGMGRYEIGSGILMYLPTIYAFTLLMSPTTVCSISIEGKGFWLLRTSPVSVNKIFLTKLFVNVLFGSIPVLISSIVCAVFFSYNVTFGVLVVLTSVMISLFAGNIGLVFNILFPKMKWENENQVVKQSLSTFLSSCSAFVFAVLLGLGAYKLKIELSEFYLLTGSVFLVLNLLLYSFIFAKGESILLNKIDGNK